jgi:hypothetical protein
MQIALDRAVAFEPVVVVEDVEAKGPTVVSHVARVSVGSKELRTPGETLLNSNQQTFIPGAPDASQNVYRTG